MEAGLSQARIRAAFESRLSTWAQAKALPVVWQNAIADMPTTDHVRAYLLPATTNARDLAGENRSYKGTFQVTICVRQGIGSSLAESLARELDDLFPVALKMLAVGLAVYVRSPMSAHTAIQDDGWYSVPVDCRYGAEEVKA